MTNKDIVDKAYGAIVGGAIGDAMGMPASFFTRSGIKREYGYIDGFLEPSTDQIWHRDFSAAEITDDTMESLIIAKILIEKGDFDEGAFIEEMRNWAVKYRMLESTAIGPSTRKFLESVVSHEDPYEKAKESTTNGSAMRVAPIGVKYWNDAETCIIKATESSLPSHGSRPCVAAACAVAAAVAAGIRGGYSPNQVINIAYEGAVYGEAAGHDIPAPSVSKRILLARDIANENMGKGISAVLDELTGVIGAGMQAYESIPFAFGVFYAVKGDAGKGIPAAVNGGDDADTNGSICGNICGAYSGSEKIPEKWKEQVKRQNCIDFFSIAKELLKNYECK